MKVKPRQSNTCVFFPLAGAIPCLSRGAMGMARAATEVTAADASRASKQQRRQRASWPPGRPVTTRTTTRGPAFSSLGSDGPSRSALAPPASGKHRTRPPL
ncbi:unnamed protein product [Ixodes pacificus]